MLIDILNDHGLEQLVHFPAREKKKKKKKKKHWIYYSHLLLVSYSIFTHRTNSAIMILLLELLSCHPPIKNIGERCIYIRNVIMNL